MIGLDTNLLVRYFTQDDRYQFELVVALMDSLTREEPGFISLVTMVELCWVLQGRSYRFSREEVFGVVDRLLDSDQLVIEREELVMEAAEVAAVFKADLADSIIQCACLKAGCTTVFTFDKEAARAAGMTLLG